MTTDCVTGSSAVRRGFGHTAPETLSKVWHLKQSWTPNIHTTVLALFFFFFLPLGFTDFSDINLGHASQVLSFS